MVWLTWGLGFIGNRFTFSNNRKGHLEVKARLDRALFNTNWKETFPNVKVTHIGTCTSDHFLLCIAADYNEQGYKEKTFCFEPMWLRNDSFQNVIDIAWKRGIGGGRTLAETLKICGDRIKDWNDNVFGNVHRKMKSLQKELEHIKKQERSDNSIARETAIPIEMDEWRLREELLWKQRSRAYWLKDGDLNTKYFHARASQRRRTNTINRLLNNDGEWMTGDQDLLTLAKRHLEINFQPDGAFFTDLNDSHFNHIEHSLSQDSVRILSEPFNEMEVQAAIFQIASTKAPGPDGFSTMFFQKFWGIVKDVVMRRITSVLNQTNIENGLGDTIITLIPKTNRPKKLDEF